MKNFLTVVAWKVAENWKLWAKKKVFKSEEQEEEQKCEKGITKALSLGQTFELGEKCEIIRCKRAKNSKSIVIIENSFEYFTLNQGFISLTLWFFK